MGPAQDTDISETYKTNYEQLDTVLQGPAYTSESVDVQYVFLSLSAERLVYALVRVSVCQIPNRDNLHKETKKAFRVYAHYAYLSFKSTDGVCRVSLPDSVFHNSENTVLVLFPVQEESGSFLTSTMKNLYRENLRESDVELFTRRNTHMQQTESLTVHFRELRAAFKRALSCAEKTESTEQIKKSLQVCVTTAIVDSIKTRVSKLFEVVGECCCYLCTETDMKPFCFLRDDRCESTLCTNEVSTFAFLTKDQFYQLYDLLKSE